MEELWLDVVATPRPMTTLAMARSGMSRRVVVGVGLICT
jgi:hypothetical protein